MKQFSSILGIIGALLEAGAVLTYVITHESTLTGQVVGFIGVAFIFIFIFFHIDDLAEAAASRSVRFSAFAITLCGLMLVVLGLINYLAFRHPQRYDATSTKLYTLSDQSIQIVQKLSDTLRITTFFDDEAARDHFEDLVDRYRTLSEKVQVTHINPNKDPVAVRQYKVAQLNSVVISYGSNDKQITDLTEEAVTNAIISVTRTASRQICFIEGHNEKTISSTESVGLSQLKEALESQAFKVSGFQLFQTQSIPDECRVVIIAGPTRSLFEAEKPLLEHWVKAGGRLIFMVDPEASPEAAAYASNWGIVAHDDLVVDPMAQMVLGNAAMSLGVPATPHAMTEKLSQGIVFFPMARSLDKLDTIPQEGNATFLLQTASKDAWGETDASILKPGPTNELRQPVLDDRDRQAPLKLMALVTLPAANDAQTPDESNPEPEAAAEKKDGTVIKKEGMVAVFGDSDFITNEFFYFPQALNSDLILNTVSYLAGEDDLISIRARNSDGKGLSMTPSEQNFVTYLSLLIVPAVPFLLGIFTYFRKRRL